MQVTIVRVFGRGGVDEVWKIEHRDRALIHNHALSLSSTAHPIHRRASRTADVREAIAVDAETAVRPRQSIVSLRHDHPDLLITPRDVYNERQWAVRAKLNGKSKTEYLLSVLDTDNYFVEHQVDERMHLTHLFFANKNAIAVYRENPDVLLMDCTHRTNRFGMPLLNIVGVTGMNTTIYVAQVFIWQEKFGDFVWAMTQLMKMIATRSIAPPQVIFTDRDLALMNALEEVFLYTPVLLCLWHIIKDVETHTRKNGFTREIDHESSTTTTVRLRDSAAHRQFCDAFRRAVRATTESEYAFRRHELHLLSLTEAAYTDDTWFDIWHRRIVRCWTNSVLHFGMESTSRVEGYHFQLKSWVGSSKTDLLTVQTRLQHWWVQSVADYRRAVADAEIKYPQRLTGKMYARVVRLIHRRALVLCADNLDKHTTPRPCKGVYSRTHGLPCVRRLHQARVGRLPLETREFHPHWWIHRQNAGPPPPPRILEPETISDRRAHRAENRRNERLAGGGETAHDGTAARSRIRCSRDKAKKIYVKICISVTLYHSIDERSTQHTQRKLSKRFE